MSRLLVDLACVALLSASAIGHGTAVPLLSNARPPQEDRDIVEQRLLAIEALSNSSGEAALEAFLAEHVAPDYVEQVGRASLDELLEDVRRNCGNAGGIGIESHGDASFVIHFETARGLWDLSLELESTAQRRIRRLQLERGQAPEALPPLSWEDFEERLETYASEGFRGAVLLVRGGEVVLDRGYGLANDALGARNTTDTLFAIGSTPIDFTKAAILLLEQRGQLASSDRLSNHLEGVPADKAQITLEQLMNGTSGLRNFHGIRGVDEDLDLSYIGRAEALRRIFSQELLFEPGRGQAHSHSAWGVLAAVVEVVSGQSYGEFLRQHLFEPAGMQRTGLYPLSLTLADEAIAVGQGRPALGKPNTPRNWGETSWLVMGSGGMVSTPKDLLRWLGALRSGAILDAEALRKYWTGGVLSGSNDRGFLTVYTEGPEDLVIFMSNSHTELRDLESKLARALVDLSRSGGPAPYAFGLVAEIGPEGVRIQQVIPGSAAEQAGLRPEDVVLRIDAQPASDVFGERLRAAARSGAELRLEIARGETLLELKIRPRRR